MTTEKYIIKQLDKELLTAGSLKYYMGQAEKLGLQDSPQYIKQLKKLGSFFR